MPRSNVGNVGNTGNVRGAFRSADDRAFEVLPAGAYYFQPIRYRIVASANDDNFLEPGCCADATTLRWLPRTNTWEETGNIVTIYDGLEDPAKRGRNFAIPGEDVYAAMDDQLQVPLVIGSWGLRRWAKVTEAGGIADGASGSITFRSNGADSSITGVAYYGSSANRDGIAVLASVANNEIVIVEWFADHDDDAGGWIIVDHGC